MGIKNFTNLLRKHAPACINERHPTDFHDKTVAIDASCHLNRFVFGGSHPHSHVLGFYSLAAYCRRHNIRPIFVFDGPSRLPEKRRELDRRERLKRKAGYSLELEKVRSSRLETLKDILNTAEESLSPLLVMAELEKFKSSYQRIIEDEEQRLFGEAATPSSSVLIPKPSELPLPVVVNPLLSEAPKPFPDQPKPSESPILTTPPTPLVPDESKPPELAHPTTEPPPPPYMTETPIPTMPPTSLVPDESRPPEIAYPTTEPPPPPYTTAPPTPTMPPTPLVPDESGPLELAHPTTEPPSPLYMTAPPIPTTPVPDESRPPEVAHPTTEPCMIELSHTIATPTITTEVTTTKVTTEVTTTEVTEVTEVTATEATTTEATTTEVTTTEVTTEVTEVTEVTATEATTTEATTTEVMTLESDLLNVALDVKHTRIVAADTDKYTRSQRDLTEREHELFNDMAYQATIDIKEPLETVVAENHNLIVSLEKRTIRITNQLRKESFDLLREMGFPCFICDGHEAEAMCSRIATEGFADAVVTEDTDALLFGDRPILRHFFFNVAFPYAHPILEIDPVRARIDLGLSREAFVDLGILCGTDFSSTIPRIGPQIALRRIRDVGSIEGILEDMDPAKIPTFKDGFEYHAARRVYASTPDVPLDPKLYEMKEPGERLGEMIEKFEINVKPRIDGWGPDPFQQQA